MAQRKKSNGEKPQEVQVVKKKPRGGNSPVIGNNGLQVEPGDNAKITAIHMELFNMSDIDMDSVEEVQQRLSDYFALFSDSDFKPTVVGMALALNGHSRQWLWSVTHDKPLGGLGNKSNLRPEITDLIKKAYKMMEGMWEAYMNSGKINPVSGIFLGKNNFGYQDKTEYVLTPNQNQDNDYDAKTIKERYLIPDNSDDEEND